MYAVCLDLRDVLAAAESVPPGLADIVQSGLRGWNRGIRGFTSNRLMGVIWRRDWVKEIPPPTFSSEEGKHIISSDTRLS